MRVLVIDDSKVSREIIKLYLRKAGIDNIDEAGDGMEALAKIIKAPEHENYDVITLDINMPKISGLALLQDFKFVANTAKIIMCSSQSDSRTVQSAIGVGVHGFIVKPFTEEKFISVFWSCLK